MQTAKLTYTRCHFGSSSGHTSPRVVVDLISRGGINVCRTKGVHLAIRVLDTIKKKNDSKASLLLYVVMSTLSFHPQCTWTDRKCLIRVGAPLQRAMVFSVNFSLASKFNNSSSFLTPL